MRFIPNDTVLDGYDRLEAGEEYDLPEDRVKHMVSHNLGTSPDIKPEPGNWSEPVTITTPALQPDDLVHGHDARTV